MFPPSFISEISFIWDIIYIWDIIPLSSLQLQAVPGAQFWYFSCNIIRSEQKWWSASLWVLWVTMFTHISPNMIFWRNLHIFQLSLDMLPKVKISCQKVVKIFKHTCCIPFSNQDLKRIVIRSNKASPAVIYMINNILAISRYLWPLGPLIFHSHTSFGWISLKEIFDDMRQLLSWSLKTKCS